MHKVIIISHSKHMFLPAWRHELICAWYESDLKNKELEQALDDYKNCDNKFSGDRNFKSLVNVLKHKIDLVSSPVPQKNPVKQTYIKRTKQNTRNVYWYWIPI